MRAFFVKKSDLCDVWKIFYDQYADLGQSQKNTTF